MNFPSTGKAIRSALYPLPLLVGQAAPILVKYDFLLLPCANDEDFECWFVICRHIFFHFLRRDCWIYERTETGIFCSPSI